MSKGFNFGLSGCNEMVVYFHAHCTSSATQNSKSLIYKLFTNFFRCLIVERWLVYLDFNTVLVIIVQKSQAIL